MIKRRSFIKTSSIFALGLGASNPYYSALTGKKKLALVKDGTAIPIIISKDISVETLHAVKDLAEYIKKISGIKPEILTDVKTRPKHAIWIGNQSIIPKLFHNLDLSYKYPEEILITCNGKHILIAGSDLIIDGKQIEYGTANAVYTFLEKYLDVRWLWPGELGEDIISKSTIELSSFVYRFHPLFLRREILQKAATWGVSDNWTRYQRLKLSSLIKGPRGGSHAFDDWWEKHHKDHPDWFALQPDGSRSGFPGPRTEKLCLSNPGVWEEWLNEVEEAIKMNPNATVFNATENDVYSSGLCVCENCRAWDHPDGTPWTYIYEDRTVDYVASTNRNIHFWNTLAQKLRERFPDRKNLYVLGLAYGSAISPPKDIVIDDHVIISFVGRFPVCDDIMRKEGKEFLKGWSKVAPRMYYRPNLWYWTGGYWGFPDMALKNIIEDFPFLADNNVMGIRIDTAREHWATQGPQYYLMAQLTWDPYKDGQKILDDYYKRGFGKAAEKIKDYWNLMEQARETITASPGYGPHGRFRFHLLKIFQDVYTRDFFDKAYLLIQQAKESISREPEIYKKRIDFVKTGLDFTRLMVDNIFLMERVRDSKGKDREAMKKSSENWKVIKDLCEKAGPVAINYNDLMEGMQQKRYMSPMEDYFGPPSEKFIKASGDGYTPETLIEPVDID